MCAHEFVRMASGIGMRRNETNAEWRVTRVEFDRINVEQKYSHNRTICTLMLYPRVNLFP